MPSLENTLTVMTLVRAETPWFVAPEIVRSVTTRELKAGLADKGQGATVLSDGEYRTMFPKEADALFMSMIQRRRMLIFTTKGRDVTATNLCLDVMKRFCDHGGKAMFMLGYDSY
jgi:hypothetical protein